MGKTAEVPVAKFGIGDFLKDKVTAYEGVVLGITFYASGCTHYGLSSKKLKTDGNISEWEWLDESRLILKKKGAVKFKTKKDGPSGPQPAAPRM